VVAGDSVYSLESLGVGWPPFAEPLRLFDQNGDGQVSLAEAEKDSSWLGSLRGIDLHSGNGDGLVTAEEYASAHRSRTVQCTVCAWAARATLRLLT